MEIKFKNKSKEKVSTFIPVKHKDILCKKCGMTNVYVTKQCCFCKEPFKIKGNKNEY